MTYLARPLTKTVTHIIPEHPQSRKITLWDIKDGRFRIQSVAGTSISLFALAASDPVHSRANGYWPKHFYRVSDAVAWLEKNA